MQSLTDEVSVDSNRPKVATDHQSVKRAVMWVSHKSDVAIPANWLLWLRKKGVFEASRSKTGSRGLMSLTKMVEVNEW